MHPHANELAMFRRPDTAKPLKRVHPIVWAQAILFSGAVFTIALLIVFGKH